MSAELLPDSQLPLLLRALPRAARPYALLARLDRPIGWWLLYWPCVYGLALAGQGVAKWPLALWMLLGAIAMRGAGCVYNDIVDRELDRMVERTRHRPLASGAVSLTQAWVWLVMLCGVGLVVLFQLPRVAQMVALGAIVPVAAYPYMKRITGWPQAWLGIVFSWGALVGWTAATGTLPLAGVLLYAGCIAWVIGYDTIYALQDIEDDALVGIGSSARTLGRHVRGGVALFYIAAVVLWGAAIWQVRADWLALVALVPAAVHLGWQVATLDPGDGANALVRFRANRFAGLLVALACLVVGSTA